ncbi:inorganic pyrophosphatase [Barnesiella viscericola]|uniref:inorganic pyrophosphatase n=1 Tax=Barnesiella viscericola TaxID=397865 RepID=UPI0025A4CA6D|nr:inorganic pyrophosphatase [Barnesiella viscericola]MDM8267797.1 inorganic pyrophosphatase [Barnesiella viscericola]
MGKDYAESFWKHLDKLLSQSKIVIDRPKGSVHPRYPQIVYELDYGYLDGTKSSDNEGIDVWLGTDAEHQLDAIVCTVDLVKRDSEIKLLIGCTPAEKSYIKSFYNEWPQMGGILIERK